MKRDPRMAAVIVDSCRADIRFYVASFVWTLDPRKERSVIPFIPYKYQENALLRLVLNIQESKKQENRHRRFDVGIDKSRDMGVTWLVLIVLDWHWRLVEKNRKFHCISRVEDDVDKTDDDDALFRKMDFIEERMPPALQVRGEHHDGSYGRSNLKIYNPKRYVVIVGESSNENAGRGGRNLAAFRDEEAFAEHGDKITKALNQTTRCQIRVSTPNGSEGSFFIAKTRGKIDWMTLHWALHPEKSAGLYSIEGGKVTILDTDWHEANPGYEFRLGPTHADPGAPWEFLRSPWFDGEEDAADSILDIAQEIQISYLGTGAPFFRADRMEEIKNRNLRDPFYVGEIGKFLPKDQYGREHKFQDRDMRPDKCKMWFHPLPNGRVPQNTTYSFGVDVAAGTGASDSSISIADDTTKAKVFEYRSNGITPEEFARLVSAVYRWFTTPMGVPFLAWDMGGHGLPFGMKLLETDIALDVYYHRNRDEADGGTRSKRPGVPSNKNLKLQLITNYRDALYTGNFITPSEEAYLQCGQFVHDGAGGVTHQKAESTEDKSDRGDQHGDVATSEAILVLAMSERPEPIPPVFEPPYDCMASRIERMKERERQESERWY